MPVSLLDRESKPHDNDHSSHHFGRESPEAQNPQCIEQTNYIDNLGYIEGSGKLVYCTDLFYVPTSIDKVRFCKSVSETECMYTKEYTSSNKCAAQKSQLKESMFHRFDGDFLIIWGKEGVERRKCFLNEQEREEAINMFYSKSDHLYEFLKSQGVVIYLGLFNLVALLVILGRVAWYIKGKYIEYQKIRQDQAEIQAEQERRLVNLTNLLNPTSNTNDQTFEMVPIMRRT